MNSASIPPSLTPPADQAWAQAKLELLLVELTSARESLLDVMFAIRLNGVLREAGIVPKLTCDMSTSELVTYIVLVKGMESRW